MKAIEPASETALQIEVNYDRCISQLTAHSRKYGVAIQSVGGIFLADERGEFGNLTYTADISSGDLHPNFSGS